MNCLDIPVEDVLAVRDGKVARELTEVDGFLKTGEALSDFVEEGLGCVGAVACRCCWLCGVVDGGW